MFKSFFFILTVVLISCRPLFAVIDFTVNYEKIVKELCINKNRPELNCNGVCYLKDQVAKSSDSQTKSKLPTAFKSLDVFVKSSVLNKQKKKNWQLKLNPFDFYHFKIKSENPFLSLRPPIV